MAGMIDTSELIPQVHAQGIPDTNQTEHATPDAFGANIGQAIEHTGQEAASSAQFFQQVQADDSVNKLLDFDTKMKYGDPNDPQDKGFFGLKGGDALAQRKTYTDKYDDFIAQQRSQLQSPNAQLQYDQMSRRYRAGFVSQVGQHSDQQADAFTAQTNKATSDLNLTAISNASNTGQPDQQTIDFHTDQMVKAAEKQATLLGAKGPDDPISQNLVREAKQNAIKAQVLSMSNTPQGADAASRFLDVHKDDAGLDYDQLHAHVKAQASQYQVDQGVADAVHQASGEVNSGTAPRGLSAHGGPYITGADGKTYATDKDGTVVQPASATGPAGPASYPAMGAAPAGPDTRHAQEGGSMSWERHEGATPQGYGAINQPYNLPLDRKGPSGVSAADTFQFLRAHGASTNEALVITGAAANESGFNSQAWHDNRTGYGMFGHKLDRLNLVGLSPQQQSLEALNELRHRPEAAAVNAAKSPEDLANAEMHYEQPQGYSNAHPENGHNYTGRLNTIRYFSQMANGNFTGANGAPVSGRLVAGPGGKMVGSEGLSGMDMMWTPQALASQPAPPPIDSAAAPAPTDTLQPAPVAQPGSAAAPTPQPAAYAITDSSPAGLQAMSGSMNAMSIAARSLQSFEKLADERGFSPEQREAGFTKLKQNYSQAQYAAESTQQQVKEQSNQSAKGYIPRIVSGDATAIADISKDPSLEFPVQKELLTMAKEWGGAQAMGMGSGYNDMLKRAALPQGDPNRISNFSQLLQMRNSGDLSDQGLTKGASVLENMKKQDFQGVTTAKSAVLDQVKNYLSYGEEGNSPGALKDPKGREANDKFVVAFEADFDARVAKGENPFDILKDQKGIRSLADSIRSPEQKRLDQITESVGNEAQTYNPASDQAPAPPAPEKVKPDTWSQVIEARPTMQTNAGPQKLRRDAWGSFLTNLLSKPTDVQQTVLKSFAQRFPGSDLETPFARLLSENQAPGGPPSRPVTPTPAPIPERGEQTFMGP